MAPGATPTLVPIDVCLLDFLDGEGLRDNTVVIYLGDNGMQWGTHDCHGIGEPYEESIWLPFMVRALGLDARRHPEQP